MTYQHERDEFINKATREGLDLATITKLLRYASTLQRLAVAQCNGDYPADNGERKTKECPQCGSGFVPSSFRESYYSDGKKRNVKVCPDCRTCELVNAILPQGFTATTGGDPRGAVLRIATPNYPYAENSANSAHGLYVPARER